MHFVLLVFCDDNFCGSVFVSLSVDRIAFFVVFHLHLCEPHDIGTYTGSVSHASAQYACSDENLWYVHRLLEILEAVGACTHVHSHQSMTQFVPFYKNTNIACTSPMCLMVSKNWILVEFQYPRLCGFALWGHNMVISGEICKCSIFIES